MEQQPIPLTEQPRAEPEIIPPGAPVDFRLRARTSADTRARGRIYVARLGPVGSAANPTPGPPFHVGVQIGLYGATKAGLRAFALALRAELAAAGVGVSIVEPGFVSDTGMFADTGIKLPFHIRTRPAAAVADETPKPASWLAL